MKKHDCVLLTKDLVLSKYSGCDGKIFEYNNYAEEDLNKGLVGNSKKFTKLVKSLSYANGESYWNERINKGLMLATIGD